MVVDTQEIETQTQSENGEHEDTAENKRQRVDLDKLAAENPHEKVSFQLPMPAEMRVMVRKGAEDAKASEAQYIRDLVARDLGYTVPESFNERKRRTGAYSGLSEEEKKEAIKAANAQKREQVNALLAAIGSGAIDSAKLAALGIDVSLLPKPRAEKEEVTA